MLLIQIYIVSLQMRIISSMETSTYTNSVVSMKTPSVNNAQKALSNIPEGYMSLDEFGEVFHRKLDEAYAKLQSDSEQ